MGKIEFKENKSDLYKTYIDIGYCESDYYFLNFYLLTSENKSGKKYFKNYSSWFENYKTESIGSQMLILRYYISEFMGWSIGEDNIQYDYFLEVYGIETTNVIKDNLETFRKFIDNWFYPQTSIFRGLDFTDFEFDDSMTVTTTDKKSTENEIEFEDGTMIRFFGEKDDLKSFFVLETDYQSLKNDIESILEKFNANQK
ncbi:MAG: hypothetical protein RLZZ323_1203 [Bacteroidota bacterium]|jgi:hypothetical protein